MNKAGAGIAITGCGSAAPKAILSNDNLAQIVETSDEWIASRTGMKNRHIASNTESLSQLSALAAQKAMKMASIAPTDIDLIIFAASGSQTIPRSVTIAFNYFGNFYPR